MSAMRSGSATCLSPRQLLGVGALLSPGTRLFGQTFFSLALFLQTNKGITRPYWHRLGLAMFEPAWSWFHYPTLIYTTDVNLFMLHAINNATAVHAATDTDTTTLLYYVFTSFATNRLLFRSQISIGKYSYSLNVDRVAVWMMFECRCSQFNFARCIHPTRFSFPEN
jgi:hypothetical protein